MVDTGFGKTIDRDSDALRWSLGTPDLVASVDDWAATIVAGQRAVTLAPGQGQAAQITMPAGVGARTAAEQIALNFSGSMTYQGKLICRELEWFDANAALPGRSQFVVLNGPDSASVPTLPPDMSSFAGFTRVPGVKYHVPLWYAVVEQSTSTVRLWDLRRWRNSDERTGYTPALSGPSRVGMGAGSSAAGHFSVDGGVCTAQIGLVFGSSGIDITDTAELRVSLPFAPARLPVGQRIAGQMFHPGLGDTLPAWLYLSEGLKTAAIVVPRNPDTNRFRGARMGASQGNGVPAVAGFYGIPDNANFLFEGSYFIR